MARTQNTPPASAVPGSKPGRPTRPNRRPRSRMSVDLLTNLAARLTPRDRWLLRMLHEHRVLTSFQITQLAFGAITTASHRMLELWTLRAVDGEQPFIGAGSAPMHYVLGEAGAAVLAAEDNITVTELGYRRSTANSILHSRHLAHTVGVNGILAALVAHARTHPTARLINWWPEHRCTTIWGDLTRPDAYGRWRDGPHQLDFFLEYDTGSEPLTRVAAKISGYTDLAEATGVTTPVLFWLPTPAREANARRALSGAPIPVATAAPHRDSTNPADRLWLPLDRTGPRLHLAELTLTHPHGEPTAPLLPGQPHRPEGPHAPVPPMPPTAPTRQ